MTHHLAQVNIARMRASHTDPAMAGFANQLAYVHSVGDESLDARRDRVAIVLTRVLGSRLTQPA